MGDRFNNLQLAVEFIEQRLGLIIRAAPIFEVPAVGFEGSMFFNSCILVHSTKELSESLQILQSIEIEMGRLPNKVVGYQNRVIDLDILFYDDTVIHGKDLIVPHPRLHERSFVLLPLQHIAPTYTHPLLHKTIDVLNKENQERDFKEGLQPKRVTGSIINLESKLAKNRFEIDQLNFIAIEGNIGSGKTSLALKISEDFNGKPVLERFADNPFLPLFYEDKERYSFPLEMSFLADRYQQLSDDVAQHELFTNFTVADYYVIKSLIFSKITLEDEEYALYKRLFNMMYKELVKPDLYVYLYQNEQRLLENIKTRGRDYEKNINAEYLSQIQHGYAEFIRSQKDLKIKVIDVTDLDFVNNQDDYIKVLNQITAAVAKD